MPKIESENFVVGRGLRHLHVDSGCADWGMGVVPGCKNWGCIRKIIFVICLVISHGTPQRIPEEPKPKMSPEEIHFDILSMRELELAVEYICYVF